MIERAMVFGLGGIGGYIGAKAGGCSKKRKLTFIARGGHLAAIRERGLRFRYPAGAETTAFPDLATADPREAGPQDLVFLCVKGYDLADACAAIAPVVGPETTVVPILNGVDIHSRVRSVLRSGIVLPAAIYVSAAIEEPGVVRYLSGKDLVVVGKGPDTGNFDPAPLEEFLSDAGIRYEWYDDPRTAIWGKYLFIASFALMTGYSGKDFGALFADPALVSDLEAVQREIVAVGRASGVAIPANAEAECMAFARSIPPTTTTSFQRDLAVPGKKDEGDQFGGTVIRLGKEFGVPTPATERIYGAIRSRSGL